jgi:capsular polysaccharide transport system permease protein
VSPPVLSGDKHLSRTIGAVIVREMQSRYTGDAIGYGWAYVTPLAWVALIYAMFITLGRAPPIDTDLGSFILSGVMPYLALRYQVNAALRIKASYRHVLQLPGIASTPIYLGIALLEFANSLLIYLLLIGLNFWVGGHFEVHHIATWFAGFAMASGCGATLGYAVSANHSRADTASRIMAVVLRPLFYISPIFYVAAELPMEVVWFIRFNPLLHAIEVLREGAFHSYQTHVGTLLVPIAFIVCCIVVGRYGELRLGHGNSPQPLMAE